MPSRIQLSRISCLSADPGEPFTVCRFPWLSRDRLLIGVRGTPAEEEQQRYRGQNGSTDGERN